MNSPPKATVAFDGSRAFEHVRQQVDCGARPAGSTELANARAYLVKELESYGLKVTQDQFTPATPEGAKQMVNLTAEIAGEATEVIMVASHYDTKLMRDFNFVGANDGGSSTGVLVELARVLAAAPKPKYTYWFVFFDGEEAFCPEWDDCKNPDGSADNTYGSRHFLTQLQARNEVKRVQSMILLDMIGYKDLRIPRESSSTRWLSDAIWQAAKEKGQGAVFIEAAEQVTDDHTSFLAAGIPSVDLIQLSGYPYWHEKEDTLDKISPRSLKIVGDVVLASLPKIEEKLAKGQSR